MYWEEDGGGSGPASLGASVASSFLTDLGNPAEAPLEGAGLGAAPGAMGLWAQVGWSLPD